MVAVGDGEWYAAVDQRLQERTDAGTHLGPRALDLAAPRRLPLPLAERVAVRVVVSGDLVAGEYDDAASSDASISRMVSLETFGPSCMSASCNTRNLPERWNWRRPRRAEMDTGRSSSGPLADAGAAIWLKSVITHSVVHTTLTVPDSTMACLERAGTLNYGLKSPFLAIPRAKSPFLDLETAISHGE